MQLDEAKHILKANGFIVEDTDTHEDEYQALRDEWNELLHKDLLTNKEMKRKWEVRRLLDEIEDTNDDVDDKIVNAKSFNIERDIPKYEKELIERFEEMGIKLEGSTPGKSQNTVYDFIYKYKGSIATMSTRLTIEQGKLMVECKLFSDYDDTGLPNIYHYGDSFFSLIEEEKEDFERKVKKKNAKKKYWIEVDFGDDDPAFDAISGLKNFRQYNVQKKWNSYIDDVNYEMTGNGTVRVEGDDKKFLEYLIQFISETDMDSVIGTEKSWG